MLIATCQSIRGDADIKGVFVVPASSQFFPPLRSTVVGKQLEPREEFLEFHLPIEQDAGWDDNEVRTPYTPIASEVC